MTSALRDLELPVMTLDRAAVRANLSAMASFCAWAGVLHAPHSKTTLSSALVRAQLSAGAWGATASSPGQAVGLLAAGAERILLANEVVDPAGLRRLAATFLTDAPPAELWLFVDSVAAVDALEAHLPAGARRLSVLLEVGYPGGRAGVRGLDEAMVVADRVRRSDRLVLDGVAGFEGLLPADGAGEPAGLGPYLDAIASTTTALEAAGCWRGRPPIVSAGGSSYFDVVAERLGPGAFDFPVRTVLRSGCYVTHDHGLYERTTPARRRPGAPVFVPALQLVAPVISTPEPGLAIVGFGRRHVPIDDALPRVLWRDRRGERTALHGIAVSALNDQHAYLRPPAAGTLAVGDVVGLGISHPCGAFDRWRRLAVVEADELVGFVATDLDPGDPAVAASGVATFV